MQCLETTIRLVLVWRPLSLSRLNGDINLNWFVYPADWFVQLVQSSFCYLIWSCQLSISAVLHTQKFTIPFQYRHHLDPVPVLFTMLVRYCSRSNTANIGLIRAWQRIVLYRDWILRHWIYTVLARYCKSMSNRYCGWTVWYRALQSFTESVMANILIHGLHGIYGRPAASGYRCNSRPCIRVILLGSHLL